MARPGIFWAEAGTNPGMEPMHPLEFVGDLDSVEGPILDGSLVSAEAWTAASADFRDWLIRRN